MDNGQAPDLQPLDHFDPSPDGWTPRTLEEVAAAGRAVLEALNAYHMALYGCRTPLNLKSVEDDLEAATTKISWQVELLAAARTVVESDAPLAIRFRYDNREPWADQTGAVLSPKQVLALARQAGKVDALGHTTYRSEVEEQDPVPFLIARDRRMGFSAGGCTTMDEVRAARAEHTRKLVLRILADVESIECGYCHAPAGAPCVTSSGGIAELSHKPRQRASTLLNEYDFLAADVNRKQDSLNQYRENQERKRYEEARACQQENRELLGVVVDDIASTLADLDR